MSVTMTGWIAWNHCFSTKAEYPSQGSLFCAGPRSAVPGPPKIVPDTRTQHSRGTSTPPQPTCPPIHIPERQKPRAQSATHHPRHHPTHSGHAGASRSHGMQMPPAMRRKRKASVDVLRLQLRKILHPVLTARPMRKILQHVCHRDPHAAYTGLATPLSRFNRDAPIHSLTMWSAPGS